MGDMLVYIPEFKRRSNQTLYSVEILHLQTLTLHQKAFIYYFQSVADHTKRPRAIAKVSENEFALTLADGAVEFYLISPAEIITNGKVHSNGHRGQMLVALSTGEVVDIQITEDDSGLYEHSFSYLGKKINEPGWEWKKTIDVLLPTPASRYPHNGDHIFYVQEDGKYCRLNLVSMQGQVIGERIRNVCARGPDHYAFFFSNRVAKFAETPLVSRQQFWDAFEKTPLSRDVVDGIIAGYTFGVFKPKAVNKVIHRQIAAPVAVEDKKDQGASASPLRNV